MSYFLIIAFTVACDQATKIWITNHFSLYEQQTIIPGLFNLTYVTNPGAAFSMLADFDSPMRHYFFLIIGSCALIALTILWFQTHKESPVQGVALALIAGGALGNLVDRVRVGEVIDFLDFYFGSYHWPAFNVADSAICIGVGIYICLTLFNKDTNSSK